MDVRLVVSFVN